MSRGLNEAVSVPFGRPRDSSRKPEIISHHAKEFLNLARLPAMLNSQQTAVLLGIAEHDIPPLIRAGHLKPLGRPPQNAVKYFASLVILELASDLRRLETIRRTLYAHWQQKNSKGSRKV